MCDGISSWHIFHQSANVLFQDSRANKKYNIDYTLITFFSVFYLVKISFGGYCGGKKSLIVRVKEVYFLSVIFVAS